MKKNLFLIFAFWAFFCFAFATNRVEINTASLGQLDEIIGIGPALGQRIIDARPFSSVDDLLRVKGIGEKTLQKIKDQGLAYVGGNPNDQTPLNSAELQRTKASGSNPNQILSPNVQNATKEIVTETPKTYLDGVVINEILPSPEGPDETNEWIELYNQNNFEVDLSGWKVEDTEGTKTTYVFAQNTKIIPNGFLILKRPETKITLNNSEDGLNILWPDGKIIDSLGYTKAPANQSYNKTSSGFNWSSSLTPGTKNIITAREIKNNKQNLSKLEKSGNSNITETGLAGPEGYPSQNTNHEKLKNSNPWFLFFAAIIITVISALSVLFIKFKLQKKY